MIEEAITYIPNENLIDSSHAVDLGDTLQDLTASPLIDIETYKNRDRALSHRDLRVLTAAIKLAVKTQEVFGLSIDKVLQVISDVRQDVIVEENIGVIVTGILTANLGKYVVPGSVRISIEIDNTEDDEQGVILPGDSILSGTINYSTGDITVNTTSLLNGSEVLASCTREYFIENNAADESTGGTIFPGIATHVKNSDVASAALNTDKDLYSRDILIYETIVEAYDIFATYQKIPSVVTLPEFKSEWQTFGSSQNLNEATESLIYSINIFKDPDSNLIYRDNVIARFASILASKLNPVDLFAIATRLNVEITSTDTNLTREPQSYVLFSETSNKRIFRTYPYLSSTQLALEFDKTTGHVVWYDQNGTPTNALIADFIINYGTFSLNIIAENPLVKDIKHYEDCLKNINLSDKTVLVTDSIEAVPYSINGSAQSKDVLLFDKYSIMNVAESYAKFGLFCGDNLPNDTQQSYVKVSFLLKASKLLTIPANKYSFIKSSQLFQNYGSEGTSILLPYADVNNSFFQSTNKPKISFITKLVNGSYSLSFKWGSTSYTKFKVSARLGDKIVWIGNCASNSGIINTIQEIPIVIAETSEQLISITVDSQEGTGNFLLHEINITNIDPTDNITAQFKISLENTYGQSIQTEDSQASIELKYEDYVVLSTGLIDSYFIDPITLFNVQLLSDFQSIVIEKCSVVRIDKVDKTPNAIDESIKSLWLENAVNNLKTKFINLENSLDPLDKQEFLYENLFGVKMWSLKSTDYWYRELLTIEPALTDSTRLSCPSDIGQPCLLPHKLSYAGDTLNFPLTPIDSYPILTVLQAWMIDLGIRVVTEKLWKTNNFALPVAQKLMILDDGLNPSTSENVSENLSGLQTESEDNILDEVQSPVLL